VLAADRIWFETSARRWQFASFTEIFVLRANSSTNFTGARKRLGYNQHYCSFCSSTVVRNLSNDTLSRNEEVTCLNVATKARAQSAVLSQSISPQNGRRHGGSVHGDLNYIPKRELDNHPCYTTAVVKSDWLINCDLMELSAQILGYLAFKKHAVVNNEIYNKVEKCKHFVLRIRNTVSVETLHRLSTFRNLPR